MLGVSISTHLDFRGSIGISFVKATESICHGYTHIYTKVVLVIKLVSWSTIFMI